METPQEFHQKEFFRFEEAKVREGSHLDRVIILVSTGTLILSINYIIGLKDKYLLSPYLLIASWIFLLISIILLMIGYKASVMYHENVIEDLKIWSQKGYLGLPDNSSKTKLYQKTTRIFTNLSLLSLILGLISITIFTIINFLVQNK